MLEKFKKQDFEQVYELMEQSFPLEERRTCAGQKKLLNVPEYQIYIIKENKMPQVRGFLGKQAGILGYSIAEMKACNRRLQ